MKVESWLQADKDKTPSQAASIQPESIGVQNNFTVFPLEKWFTLTDTSELWRSLESQLEANGELHLCTYYIQNDRLEWMQENSILQEPTHILQSQ